MASARQGELVAINQFDVVVDSHFRVMTPSGKASGFVAK